MKNEFDEEYDFDAIALATGLIENTIKQLHDGAMYSFGKSIGSFDLYRNAAVALQKVLDDYIREE